MALRGRGCFWNLNILTAADSLVKRVCVCVAARSRRLCCFSDGRAVLSLWEDLFTAPTALKKYFKYAH